MKNTPWKHQIEAKAPILEQQPEKFPLYVLQIDIIMITFFLQNIYFTDLELHLEITVKLQNYTFF